MNKGVPVSRSQPVLGNNAALANSPPRPEKLPRVRANSMSSPPPQPARKRTSSGVFQVDESEPVPKKAEHAETPSEGALKKTKLVKNGRRKLSETPENKTKEQSKEKKIIEKFDSTAKTKCVTAFKESDSWD